MFNENDIEHSYTIKCDECGTILGEYIRYKSGYVRKPNLPEGWNKLNNKLYCDKHKIIIK